LPKEPEPESPLATPVDSLLPGQTAAAARERSQPINEETPYRGQTDTWGKPLPAKKSQPTVLDVHVNRPNEDFSIAYVQGLEQTQPKKKKKKKNAR
jgi:hypothetical protein